MGCSSSRPLEEQPVTNTPNPLTKSRSIRLDWDSVKLADFVMGKKLGSGQYADVFQCTHKQNGCQYAMKVMDKSKMSTEEKAGLVQEIQILKECDHHHVMNLYGHFEMEGKAYLVTELLRGGELFDRIVSKDPPHYSEKSAQAASRMILEAIAYLHSKGITHRDLKPENLILESEQDDQSAKIADFGFAAKPASKPMGYLTDGVGTPGYVAPEIIKLPRHHGLPCDIWSFGVIVYILICGYPPFYHENDAKLFKMIKLGKFTYDVSDWADVSDGCKDFINKALIVDVEKRWTAAQLMQHPWIVSAQVSDKHRDKALAAIKSLKAKQRWKKAGSAVRATVRMKAFMDLAHNLTAEELASEDE